MLLVKEILNNSWSFLTTSQMRTNVRNHFLPVFWSLPSQGIRFHVLVQQFIRIKFRAISRQVKKPDFIFMVFHPTFYSTAAMNRMTVNDQEHLTFDLPGETRKKLNEYSGLKLFHIYHEKQFSAISDCRDHVTSESLARPSNHRRLPPQTIAGSRCMIGTKPHFVFPQDNSTGLLGASTNLRKLIRQPSTHRLRVSFIRSLQRLLRGKTPSRQIASSRPTGYNNSKSPLYQRGNGISCPKAKGQLHLVRAPIYNRSGNLRRLPRFKTATKWPTAFSSGQRSRTTQRMLSHPPMNSHTRDAMKACDRYNGFSRSHIRNSLTSNQFLNIRFQRSEINMCHALNINQAGKCVKYLLH
jgi:hypothetical protein